MGVMSLNLAEAPISCHSRRLSNESSVVSRSGDVAHCPAGVLELPPKTPFKFGLSRTTRQPAGCLWSWDPKTLFLGHKT